MKEKRWSQRSRATGVSPQLIAADEYEKASGAPEFDGKIAIDEEDGGKTQPAPEIECSVLRYGSARRV